MKKLRFDDTIAAISTPIGEGGIGIVRMSGPAALGIADKIFKSKKRKKPSRFKTYTTHYGRVVDDVILTVMRAPKTYTREDVVEINCHGGIVALQETLELVMRKGARLAEPGEFTRRAFLNGRIDLSQAEAVLDVIRSKTDAALRVAAAQLDGDLTRILEDIKKEMLDILAALEAAIDFPDEDLTLPKRKKYIKRLKECANKLRVLLRTAKEGRVLREGVMTVICGKPNVGKSSLMNALLKAERVIVTSIPGTTRDTVEEVLNIRGIPIRIVDTAGIIETKDIIEQKGVQRSRQYLKSADLVIFVLDSSRGLSKEDRTLASEFKGKKVLVVLNKSDIRPKVTTEAARRLISNAKIVKTAAAIPKGIPGLESAISEVILKGGVHSASGTILSNTRHAMAIEHACVSLERVRDLFMTKSSEEFIALELKSAMDALGEVTGETIPEDVLDRIFSQFCIGK